MAQKEIESPNYQELIGEYLKNKYPDEELDFSPPSHQKLYLRNIEFYVSGVVNKNNPDDVFSVFIDPETKSLKDNRFLKNVDEEFNEMVFNQANEIWNNPVVDAGVSLGMDMPEFDWPDGADYFEFIEKETSAIPVILMSVSSTGDPSEDAKRVNQLIRQLESENLIADFNLYFDKPDLEAINAFDHGLHYDLRKSIPSLTVIENDVREVENDAA